ncbi:MAG: hypothetical protein HC906_15470, partial [Bacteroidales bacterium]|nr:hypothetical protein [Bacteroidales bacterium]
MKYFYFFILSASFIAGACHKNPSSETVKQIIVDGNQKFQVIEGFGVNLNPDLWMDGKFIPALDMIIDDLGSTQFRFDCFGRANWLEPDKQQPDGTWSAEYLREVYTSKTFSNAWEIFRYLNKKGIEPYFNVSGVVPPEWNKPGTNILMNFEAYSEMVCTMLNWARNNENLEFSMLAPYNETDFDGSREGPCLPPENRIEALKVMVNALDRHNFHDIKLVVFCDATFDIRKIEPLLKDTSFIDRVAVISGHHYGNGDEGDGEEWYTNKSKLGIVNEAVKNSPYRNANIWLNEYGDLDQTGEIENEFSWRITRRVLKALKDGASSCQFWDACDNFHKHDTAWSTFGLLSTDTVQKTFSPKRDTLPVKMHTVT